jgi:hypothetical protein
VAAEATAPFAAMVLLRGLLAFLAALLASVFQIVRRSRNAAEA